MATAMQSTVRLPTPEPAGVQESRETARPRKRSPSSRSPSPRREAPRLRRRSDSRSLSRSPPPRRNGAIPRDVDRSRAFERARQLEIRQRNETTPPKALTDAEKQAAAKAEYDKLVNMRSGGTYIPPARLRALQTQITDKTSKEYQRMAWESLKKSINGLINKVNVSNIKEIVPDLFSENLVRGRGLFCRSIMKAQSVSLPFTPILAAMVAVVNTKLPQVGELLINRLVIQFRKAFKRNDKSVCLSSTTFIAHLINQQVAHEMLAAQMLLLLLHKPTDDSVEIAVGLMKEVGQHIETMNSQIALAVYDQFRSILHEAEIDKRTQYMIEVLFQIRKDKYKDHEAIREELDLVEEEDQITHRPALDDQLSTEDGLNIFKFDSEYEANEEQYRRLKAEILGEGSESDGGDDDSNDDASSEESEEDVAEKAVEIKDQSNTDLVNLRRSIYLTIMSSGGFEEACHKLMRINLPAGREEELPSMIIECCSQERTYNKFFGLIGERFCKLNRLWKDLFESMFTKYYDTIHRYETNRLRIIATFFGHLLTTDAIGWHVFSVIHLNEEETTSSSRIFIKILTEDLAQGMGMKALTDRFKEDALSSALAGIFPTDDPKSTRFSINFFTAIGMGVLTEGMREWLKNMPKPAPLPLPIRSRTPSSRGRSESVSSYSSYSSYSSRSYSSRSRSRSRTAPTRRTRGRSPTKSISPSRRDSRRSLSASRSRTPPRRRARSASQDSRSPPTRRNGSRRRSRPSSRPKSTSPRGRRDSYSDHTPSRSPSGTRGPSAYKSRASGGGDTRRGRGRDTRSPSDASPPRRRYRSDSRSPRRNSRGRSDSRSLSPRPRKRDPSYSSYDSRSRSRTPPRNKNVDQRRRRNSSSVEVSPQPRPKHLPRDKRESAPAKAEKKSTAEEDLSHIHPSRRGLMGGGRAKASDLI